MPYDPAVLLAHVLEGEQNSATAPNYVLLVLGGVAVLAALWFRRRSRAAFGVAAVAALALLTAGLLFETGGGRIRPDVTLGFSVPRPGATVPAGEPVDVGVIVEGARVAVLEGDTTGGHLHISVDGQLRQMPYGTGATVELEPGRHTLTVEYVDHDHISYDPPIETSMEVTAKRQKE